MQRFVSTLWCQFPRTNLFWKSPLFHLFTWEFWKRQHPPLPQTAPERPPWRCSHSWASRHRAHIAWEGDAATAQCSGWSLCLCVFDPIPSLRLVRETLTTQTPSVHKALATPFTADSGTAFKIEMTLLSRKTKHTSPWKEGDYHYLCTGILTKSEAAGGGLATGYLKKHLLADTGGKKSKDITSMLVAPDLQQLRAELAGSWHSTSNMSANTGMEHSCLSPESRQSVKGTWMSLTACFCSLKFCSSAAGTAISYSRVKGPAYPLRSRSNARQP